jgi:hypothetical protein
MIFLLKRELQMGEKISQPVNVKLDEAVKIRLAEIYNQVETLRKDTEKACNLLVSCKTNIKNLLKVICIVKEKDSAPMPAEDNKFIQKAMNESQALLKLLNE